MCFSTGPQSVPPSATGQPGATQPRSWRIRCQRAKSSLPSGSPACTLRRMSAGRRVAMNSRTSSRNARSCGLNARSIGSPSAKINRTEMEVTNVLFDMTGRVALITGSPRGIGRAIAERMAEAGAKVVISSRKADACAEVAAAINAHGGTAIAHAANISDRAALQGLVDRTLHEWGRIDVLVCNAAVNPYYGPLLEIPDEAFDKIMASNVRSNLWLCKMVIPQMAERREGSVVVISSIAGLKGNPVLGAYGISKAADFQLVRNLAVEWGPSNVRVNAIAPAIIRTDFARKLWEDPAIYAHAVSGYPLRRIGEPDEVAGAAIFLASRAGAFCTGQVITVDGGMTIGGEG